MSNRALDRSIIDNQLLSVTTYLCQYSIFGLLQVICFKYSEGVNKRYHSRMDLILT